MTYANEQFFVGSEFSTSRLAAGGFDLISGAQSGGIIDPDLVAIPVGSILFRTYRDPAKLWGGWWSTAYELNEVYQYFARGGAAAAVGRSEGKGILQATLAIRHDWDGNHPDHLSLFAAVRTVEPLKAYFGPGKDAPTGSQTSNMKPAKIIGSSGVQRRVNQLFMPQPYKYQSAFQVIVKDQSTDASIVRVVADLNRGPLPFESA